MRTNNEVDLVVKNAAVASLEELQAALEQTHKTTDGGQDQAKVNDAFGRSAAPAHICLMDDVQLAMHMNEKMDAAWRAFFGDKDIGSHYQVWKATLEGGKDRHGAIKLSDWLDQLVTTDKSRALLLKKAVSAWVGSRDEHKVLLDFDRQGFEKHKDKRQVAFAEQVIKHLASKGKSENDDIEIVFDVLQVEQTDTLELDVHGETGPESLHQAKKDAAALANGPAITDIEFFPRDHGHPAGPGA